MVEDEEEEEGELVEGAASKEQSLQKVKAALIGILDEETFSIRTCKK